MHLPRRIPVEPRPLSSLERQWIEEILQHNPLWADVDFSDTKVIAKCSCDKCKTVYLDSPRPQNPSLAGTNGYIGRIEIRTTDDFGITITLDQLNGKLSELYIDPIDLREPGNRALPEHWHEKGHVTISM